MSETSGGPPRRMPSAFAPGTRIGDGVRIGRSREKTAFGVCHEGVHDTIGAVEVHVLDARFHELVGNIAPDLGTLGTLEHPTLQRFVGLEWVRDVPVLIVERVEGVSLRRHLEELGAEGLGFRPAYNIIGHVAAALGELHEASHHGDLSPDTILLQPDGRVRLIGMGLGRLASALRAADGTADAAGVFTAPEVREDPWAASEVSDFWSLGVLATLLWLGREPTSANLPHLVDELEAEYTEPLAQLVRNLTMEEPGMRIGSFAEVREALPQVLRSVRLVGLSGEASAGVPGPAGPDEAPEPDYFAGIDLPPAHGEDRGEERWIVRQHGRDYGPFSVEAVLRKLRADEIDEYTTLMDLRTQVMQDLGEIDDFRDAVAAYLPEREARREAEQLRREEIQRTARRAGRATLVSVLVFVPLFLAATVGVFVYVLGEGSHLFVRGEPYPFERLVRNFAHAFEVEPPEYEAIEADEGLLARLRTFDEPQRPQRRRAARAPSGAGGDAMDEDRDLMEDFVLDFNSDAPARTLTQAEVRAAVQRHMDPMLACFQPELRANPNFRGADVSFSIHPDGRSFNISVGGRGRRVSPSLDACLTRAFRGVRFPAFNDVPMNVTYPFHLQ